MTDKDVLRSLAFTLQAVKTQAECISEMQHTLGMVIHALHSVPQVDFAAANKQALEDYEGQREGWRQHMRSVAQELEKVRKAVEES